MDASTFNRKLTTLTAADIAAAADALRVDRATVASDVNWQKASAIAQSCVAHSAQRHTAGRAGHQASLTIQSIGADADQSGLSHADVVCVARAASLTASALVVLDARDGPGERLLRPWAAALHLASV